MRYSTHENICQKRRKKIVVGSLQDQSFLAVLKLPLRVRFGYSKGIKCCPGIIEPSFEDKI